METKPKRTFLEWTKIYLGIHFSLLLLPIIGVSSFIFSQSFLRQIRLKPVQGTILVSRAEPCPDGMFRPRITFSYTVERQTFTTGRYRDDGKLSCQSEATVDELLAKYRPGTVKEAWYDPRYVKFAILDRTLGIVPKVSFIVAVAGVLILACMLWLYRIGMRKREQHAIEE